MIRDLDWTRDLAAVRACFIELQDFERSIDPRIPAGESIVDAYLKLMFERCQHFAGTVLVAERAGAIVGFVCVWTRFHSDEPDDGPAELAFISDLVVRSTERRLGIGRTLLEAAEAHARRAGSPRLQLAVKAGNVPALGLYEKAGYRSYELLLEKSLT